MMAHKNEGPPKIWSKKLSQNGISYRIIADIEFVGVVGGDVK